MTTVDRHSNTLCKYFMHGACNKGTDCLFSHNLKDLPNQTCTHWLKGHCSFGDKCRYEHVRSEWNRKEQVQSHYKAPTIPKPTTDTLDDVLPISHLRLSGTVAHLTKKEEGVTAAGITSRQINLQNTHQLGRNESHANGSTPATLVVPLQATERKNPPPVNLPVDPFGDGDLHREGNGGEVSERIAAITGLPDDLLADPTLDTATHQNDHQFTADLFCTLQIDDTVANSSLHGTESSGHRLAETDGFEHHAVQRNSSQHHLTEHWNDEHVFATDGDVVHIARTFQDLPAASLSREHSHQDLTQHVKNGSSKYGSGSYHSQLDGQFATAIGSASPGARSFFATRDANEQFAATSKNNNSSGSLFNMKSSRPGSLYGSYHSGDSASHSYSDRQGIYGSSYNSLPAINNIASTSASVPAAGAHADPATYNEDAYYDVHGYSDADHGAYDSLGTSPTAAGAWHVPAGHQSTWEYGVDNGAMGGGHGSTVHSLCWEYYSTGVCSQEGCSMEHGEYCETCQHYALHPSDEEAREQHMVECMARHDRIEARMRSAHVECGICLEKVLEKHTGDRKFGLLQCDHAFCLKCIRDWRQNYAAGADVDSALRTCPVCRVTTHFITPSSIWPSTPEEKEAIVSGYKQKLASIDCRYFNYGEGTCPFGSSCMYKHAYPDGRLEDAAPRRVAADEGEVRVVQPVRLSDFIVIKSGKARGRRR